MILSTYIQVPALAAFPCSPFLILFLLFFLLCSYLSCSLISARIRSKNITPETQLSHWAKCAAHKLRYPSKAFHTPTLLNLLSSDSFTWFSLHKPYVLFTCSACLVFFFFRPFFSSMIILEMMWNECSRLFWWNEKDHRMDDEAIHIHKQPPK